MHTAETYSEIVAQLQGIISDLQGELHEKTYEAMRREVELKGEISMLEYRLDSANYWRDYWKDLAERRLTA